MAAMPGLRSLGWRPLDRNGLSSAEFDQPLRPVFNPSTRTSTAG